MFFKWIFPILLIKNVCSVTNNKHSTQTKSLPELQTSRFNILSGTFEDQNSPENYFPDIEYPADILDVGKPFYFKATDNAFLEPFPRDVKDSFKHIATGGKTVEEPVVKHNIAEKPAQPISTTSSNLLKNEQKDKTAKTNSTNVLTKNIDENGDSTTELKNVTDIEHNSTESLGSQEMSNSSEENFRLLANNITSSTKEFKEEDEAVVSSEEFM